MDELSKYSSLIKLIIGEEARELVYDSLGEDTLYFHESSTVWTDGLGHSARYHQDCYKFIKHRKRHKEVILDYLARLFRMN